MKNGLKALMTAALAFTLSALCVREARAYITLNGMVPVGQAGTVILQAHKRTGTTNDTLKFKFTAPSSTGGGYILSFCIGPATNPCGLPTSYVVSVPASEERLAVVPSNVFTDNVLVVAQGTNRPVPYSVMIE